MWRNLRRALAEGEKQRLIEFKALQTALQEASGVASQSWQRVEESEVSSSGLRLAAQRSQELAELAAQSALRAAAAAEACLKIGEQNALGGQMAAKAAESAAASALRSAEAAAEAAQSNRVIAELGKRAWVHAAEFRASLKTQGNENSTLEVRIANLGSTPARELKVSTSFQIENEVPDELPLKPRVTNIVMGPGVSFSISHFLRLSPADVAAISTGRRVLLACGQADYVDVLGMARQTRWCAIYNYSGNSFAAAAKHNLTT